MIILDVPGVMRCEHEGCEAWASVTFVLNGSGGFGFKAGEEAKDWQVLLPAGPAGLGAPFRAHCAQHKQALPPPKRIVQVGPAGPRKVALDG